MKKLQFIAAVLLCCAGVMIACQKEDSANTANTTETKMATDKLLAKPGEAVAVSVENGTPGAVAKWRVTPNTNVSMNRSYSFDQKNTITFNEAGTYVVSAEIRKVWCSEVTAANPGMDTCLNSGTVTANVQTIIRVSN